MANTAAYDSAAATLSLACIAHCVALPLLTITLPFVASISEAEWVHWTLTALSVTASVIVVMRAHDARKATFLAPAGTGIAFLISALFAESFGIEESWPTVIGGLLLATAHITRLFKHS